MGHKSRAALALLLGAVMVMGVACTSDGKQSEGEQSDGGDSEDAGTEPEPVAFEGRSPADIAAPATPGGGPIVPQPAAPLPEGYIEEEYLIGGTATSFEATETPGDGFWVAEPAEEAEYRTRVIVRRPESPEDFSGTVVLEWFNVSAIEASPDWAYLSGEIGREGHAYIGVSAQAQGVEGGETILDVEVDADDAAAAGVSTDGSGLVNTDPQRYGTLTHPGDAWSFDIFSQVGRAVAETPGQLLGDLEPTAVIAAGESQSAGYLTTLVNAVHPLDPVFDGFLVHSRGANAAPLDGEYLSARDVESVEELTERSVLIRTDLEVPVMIFETETDLTLLGYATARQPDTELVRTWEVAGTAHADAQFVRAILGGPRDPGVASLLGCTEPVNTGPHAEVVQAALHHLAGWVADGTPPPEGERLEMTDDDEPAIARDDLGIALGGVRTPLVDVPVVVLSGDPPTGSSAEELTSGEVDVCVLFGSTTALDPATLSELYRSADDYVAEFTASADAAVEAGFLLAPDAEALVAETDDNRALFG